MPIAPGRRWFQVSIKSMLWLMLVIALTVVAANEHRHRLRLQAEVDAVRAAEMERAAFVKRLDRRYQRYAEKQASQKSLADQSAQKISD